MEKKRLCWEFCIIFSSEGFNSTGFYNVSVGKYFHTPSVLFEGYFKLKLWTLFNFNFYFRQFSFFMSAEAIYSKGKRLIFDLQKLIEFEKNLGIGGEGGGAYVSLFQTNNFYWKDQILPPSVCQKWNRKIHNSQLLWKYYEHYADNRVSKLQIVMVYIEDISWPHCGNNQPPSWQRLVDFLLLWCYVICQPIIIS